MILSWVEAGQEQEFFILPRWMLPRFASARKTPGGVRGWVTALVFPHCSVIFLHFPGQPAALCTRHWPSACVQTGRRLNVGKSSWWDRNWTDCHKERASSKRPVSLGLDVGHRRLFTLAMVLLRRVMVGVHINKKKIRTRCLEVTWQVELIGGWEWHFWVMCKEPYCVYIEPGIDRWIDEERRKEEKKRICLLCVHFYFLQIACLKII